MAIGPDEAERATENTALRRLEDGDPGRDVVLVFKFERIFVGREYL